VSETLRSRLYVLAILVLGVVVTALVLTSPSEADRVERLGNSIRCPVCQGESIADSPSTMARDMMDLVSERVTQGRSDEEIVDELLRSYSGAVLLDPPASGSTLVLWLAPVAALLIGAGVIVWWERHPGETASGTTKTPAPRSKRRMLVGGLVLTGTFAAIVVVAGFFLQNDPVGSSTAIAGLEGRDLDEVSNETMEAVIAANLDNPQIRGMRLALAERYYSEGAFSAAFPHYLSVAESPSSTESQLMTALIRLGWMAWEGNQEVDAALGMFDQALALDPDSSTALYLKGQVLWCGAGDLPQAETLFDQVLSRGDLPEESLDVA
jgi:cytochrome c-type biogenesis protein CcmH